MIGLWAATGISFLLALGYVLLGIPVEATQGLVQKIFFFHVPAAFALYVCVILGTISSCLYLWDRRKIFDNFSRACMVVALVFGIVVLTSGPLWAKPIWGVYWTWDPRLTTTFVVFVLLLGYHGVRWIYPDHESSRGAILGAVIAILAVIDIPLIHFSVKLWRGIHPSVLKNPDGLPQSFVQGLEAMIVVVLMLMSLSLWIVFHLYQMESKVRETENHDGRYLS